jgi:hypothetical protein
MSYRAVGMRSELAEVGLAGDVRRSMRHHRLSLLSVRRAASELRGARMVLEAARRVNAGEGLSHPSRCDGAMVRAARARCERIEREIAVIYRGRWLV